MRNKDHQGKEKKLVVKPSYNNPVTIKAMEQAKGGKTTKHVNVSSLISYLNT